MKSNQGCIKLIVVIFVFIVFISWIVKNKTTNDSYVPVVKTPDISTQSMTKPSAVDFVIKAMHNKDELEYENWLSYFDSNLVAVTLKGVNANNYKDIVDEFKLLDLSKCKILNPVDEELSTYYKKMKIEWTDIVTCEVIQGKVLVITLNYDSIINQYRIINLGTGDSMY